MKNKQTVVSCLYTSANDPQRTADLSLVGYSIYTQRATERDGGIASTYTLHNAKRGSTFINYLLILTQTGIFLKFC